MKIINKYPIGFAILINVVAVIILINIYTNKYKDFAFILMILMGTLNVKILKNIDDGNKKKRIYILLILVATILIFIFYKYKMILNQYI